MPDDPNRPPGPAGAPATRRDVLTCLGLGACAAACVGSGVVTLDYLKPKVLFEPPTTFRAGSPIDFPEGTVRFNRERKAYVIGAPGGVYALSAVCTHLGCITAWHPEHELIECPCHGSKFKEDGIKVAGPAPRPLPHFGISLTVDGELLVDKLQIIKPSQVLKV
jgi:cytochrome b6-f complex iron-sulfur subunit